MGRNSPLLLRPGRGAPRTSVTTLVGSVALAAGLALAPDVGLASPHQVATVSAAVGAAPAAPGTDVATLAADLEALRRDAGLTGLVWSTLVDGHIEVGATGVADASTGTALRPDARVHVGSVAKTVLALTVLRRVSQGALDLDAPVATLLPDLPLDNPWAQTHPLRVRHLIDMSGGLDDLRLWQFFGSRNAPDAPLAEVLTRDPGLLRLRTPPGEQFSYSNASFTLAALVLEASTGERYERWAERELLRPLGMRDSSFAYSAPTRTGADRQAWGHVEGGGPVVTPAVAVRPAGQFVTTAADMARFAAFLLGDGTVDGRQLVDPALLRAMGVPTTTALARAGVRTGYGLGLFTRDRHGAIGRCHGGSTAGFRAMLCVFPAEGRAFFSAFNMDDEDAPYDAFDARFVRHLGVAHAAEPVGGAAPAAHAAWTGRYVSAPSRLSQAALIDRLLGSSTLRVDGPVLLLQPAGAPPRRLQWIDGVRYRPEDRLQATYALLRDARGRPMIAGPAETLRRIGAAEFWGLWLVVGAGLAGLLWWLVVPLVRAWRTRAAPRAPAGWGVFVLLAAFGAVALQPWQRLADFTAASAALYAATLLAPLGLAWQALLATRQASRAGPWRVDLAAACAGLAFLAVAATFGLMPLALWRL